MALRVFILGEFKLCITEISAERVESWLNETDEPAMIPVPRSGESVHPRIPAHRPKPQRLLSSRSGRPKLLRTVLPHRRSRAFLPRR